MRETLAPIQFPSTDESTGETLRGPDMEAILSEQSIATVFHPIVSMGEQKIVGVEALSRGIDPYTGNIVPPAVLFETARRHGRVLDLDRLCRKKSLSAFDKRFARTSRYMLWLNFDPGLLDITRSPTGTLRRQAAEFDLDPRRIVIEIVESQVEDSRALEEFVKTYRRAGFLIAIDDWGEAYSNMDRIYRLRPDIIKIHHSLACKSDSDARKRELVGAMLSLARSIGALSVVEGVETRDAAFIARDLGASFMQGFYFCKPTGSRSLIETECSEKLRDLSSEYKFRRLRMFESRRRYFEKLDSFMEETAERLYRFGPSQFEQALEEMIGRSRELECAYILDAEGIQITRAVCSPRKGMREAVLFHPPGKGADRSTENFFLHLRTRDSLFVSTPYTSLSTGRRCVTMSKRIAGADGLPLILCADCDCHEQSLAQ